MTDAFLLRSVAHNIEGFTISVDKFPLVHWDDVFAAAKAWLLPGTRDLRYIINSDWRLTYGATHLVMLVSTQRDVMPVGIHFYKWAIQRPWVMVLWDERTSEWKPFSQEAHVQSIIYWIMRMQDYWCTTHCPAAVDDVHRQLRHLRKLDNVQAPQHDSFSAMLTALGTSGKPN
jgi:hypothetical protein